MKKIVFDVKFEFFHKFKKILFEIHWKTFTDWKRDEALMAISMNITKQWFVVGEWNFRAVCIF